MKIILFAFGLFAFSFLGQAQDSHIAFESGNWEAALKKAKEENKIIFVDAYTSWCGPCKMMAKNVFTDANVSSFYNDQFVNMKIDMEKGEGILFAKAYGVRAYPTFLFIDSKGSIAHKGLGYMQPANFIEFGRLATDEENRLGALEAKYKKGDRSPELLKKYSVALKKAYDKTSADIAEEYLAGQSDWTSEENATYIVDMASDDPKSNTYKYLAEHRSELSTFADANKIDQKLKAGVSREIHAKNMNLEEQENHFNKLFDEKGGEYFAEYNMRKYSRMSNDDMKANYFEAAEHYINTYSVTNWSLLNQVAWKFYENTDDKKLLKIASKWAITSIEGESHYMNNDTAAALFYKLEDKKKAMHYAEEAIRLAKENGEDYKTTAELLSKIESL